MLNILDGANSEDLQWERSRGDTDCKQTQHNTQKPSITYDNQNQKQKRERDGGGISWAAQSADEVTWFMWSLSWRLVAAAAAFATSARLTRFTDKIRVCWSDYSLYLILRCIIFHLFRTLMPANGAECSLARPRGTTVSVRILLHISTGWVQPVECL